jgi:ribonuclease III
MSLYPPRQKQLQRLLRHLPLLDTSTVDWTLVDLALTHPSVSEERNYDRLEFVGDSVIRMAVAEFLWVTYPELQVGDYTAIRSVLVSDRQLAEWANGYDLDTYLITHASEDEPAGYTSRLADAFEALLGALYLSANGTLQLIQPWLTPHLQRVTTIIQQDPAHCNYKAALQEWTQARHKSLPHYSVQEQSNPSDPDQRFRADVSFLGQSLGIGTGRSRKAAEQAAAKVAFLLLKAQKK